MAKGMMRQTAGLRPWTLALLTSLTMSMLGCEDRQARSYQATKDQTPALEQLELAPGQDAHAPRDLTWTLPAGWVQDETPRPMRVATFFAGTEATGVEVTITKFPGDVGGVRANLNRWREQVGLTALGEQEAAAAIAAGRTVLEDQTQTAGYYFDLTGPASESAGGGGKRMLTALFERKGETWFFKMMGQAQAVGAQEATFKEFLRSLRFK